MSRGDLQETAIRAALETIATEVAFIQDVWVVTRLRVEQARQRTGLSGLLSPALDELDDVNQAVSVIREQVSTALAKLLER
jgi:hypothetical protein